MLCRHLLRWASGEPFLLGAVRTCRGRVDKGALGRAAVLGCCGAVLGALEGSTGPSGTPFSLT